MWWATVLNGYRASDDCLDARDKSLNYLLMDALRHATGDGRGSKQEKEGAM
jgi:hypothetical protein